MCHFDVDLLRGLVIKQTRPKDRDGEENCHTPRIISALYRDGWDLADSSDYLRAGSADV